MNKQTRKIRIFVASPGDVLIEREQVVQVVAEINSTVGQEKNCMLEVVKWETHATPDMGRAQDVINKQIGPYDIFIGIMWKRFGSPTGLADSGTEEEFRLAYESWKKRGIPRILFYFCNAVFAPPRTLDEIEQLKKISTFRNEISQKGLVWEYTEHNDFANILRPHLIRLLNEILSNKSRRPKDNNEKVKATTRRKLIKWGDTVLNYAYYFDSDGRKCFYLIDIEVNWQNAYQLYLREGTVHRNIDILMSQMPMDIDPDSGLQKLDYIALEATLDYLVTKGFLRKEKHGLFKERYEITETGRAYFSSKLLAKSS